MATERLVLLGGGHAHLQVLRAFAAAPLSKVEITLVSPFPALIYSGLVPALIAGHAAPADCEVPLAPLARRAGAVFRLAAATSIDAAARCVTLAHADGRRERVRYDRLSIDIGGVVESDAIPGAAEHALFVRPIERFVEALPSRLRGRPVAAVGVVVVGGGAGGFELALGLRTRLGGAVPLHWVTGGPLLASHAAGVRRHARRAAQRRAIQVHEERCTKIAVDHVVLSCGARIACDLAVLAIGSQAPRWLRSSGLALDAHGHVATGPTLQSLSHAEVFAAGDVASRPDAPRPHSGVYAVRAGPPLAHNLRAALAGQPLVAWCPQRRALNLLSCGDGRAIASWGAWSSEGRWVWWLKDRIDRRFVARSREP